MYLPCTWRMRGWWRWRGCWAGRVCLSTWPGAQRGCSGRGWGHTQIQELSWSCEHVSLDFRPGAKKDMPELSIIIKSTRACWGWSPDFLASGCWRAALWLRRPSPRPACPETRGSRWSCPCAFCKHNRERLLLLWNLKIRQLFIGLNFPYFILYMTSPYCCTAHCYRHLGDIGSCHVKTTPTRK